MLRVEFLCVGKIKQSGLDELIQDYCLRLKSFCKLKIIELPKYKNSNGISSYDCLKVEEANILKKLDFSSFKIALCVEGVELSSEEFAARIFKVQNSGFSKISFIIGGAFGLSDLVKKVVDFRMSFSRMTLPHKMMRLFLIEQFYRAMTILNGRSYHK